MQWGWYGPGSGYMRGMSPVLVGGRRAPGAVHGDLPLPARLRVRRAPLVGPEPRAALGRGRRGPRATARAYQPHARGGDRARRPRRDRRGRPRVATWPTPGRPSSTSWAPRSPSRAGRRRPAGCRGPPTWPGQRLTKSIEAGFMPVAVVAALASVRVWAYCMTEYLMEGSAWAGAAPTGPAAGRAGEQGPHGGAPAGPQARPPAAGRRRAPRRQIDVVSRELSQGDEVIDCTLRGNRMRRFKDFDPVAAPEADGAAGMSASRPAPPARRPGRDAPRRPVAGRRPPPPSKARGITSDLSVDEALLLHAAGWEPLDLVCGVAWSPSRSACGTGGRVPSRWPRTPTTRRWTRRPGSCAASAARCTATAWSACGWRCRCARTTSTSSSSARRCGPIDGKDARGPTPPRPCRSCPTSRPATSRCCCGPAGCPSGSPSAPASSTRPGARPAPP